MRRSFHLLAAATLLWTLGCSPAGGSARLSREVYRDKCAGAWLGQMIGVCYGEPYQFQSNGKPVLEPIPAWDPAKLKGAIRQDDVYVELTFLKALETHGLGITPEQAGTVFAAAPYPLWHANMYGRWNIQRGIMPPLSGHPQYNRHADDIDFQIEADLFGIIAPGLPGESNRLCDVFGHIMNYGDGVYGGMFVAGMYTEAYFESSDVEKVIRAGLACIPRESQYYQCMADTLAWCREFPEDWTQTWRRVEARWNDDLDCVPGNPHNIDAKINGAYIVIGLMYGGGDFLKTIEVCTRCGQDADSSTANAGGIIGCMKGLKALGAYGTGLAAVENEKFLGVDYTPATLTGVCEAMAEKVIVGAGGSADAQGFTIPRQAPRPPATLEQWTNERELIHKPLIDQEVKLWNPQWRIEQAKSEFTGGFFPREVGRTNALVIVPITPDRPAAIAGPVTVPESGKGTLSIEAATETQHGDVRMRVLIAGKVAFDEVIDTAGEFKTIELPVEGQANAQAEVRIEFHANEWAVNAAYVRNVGCK